MLYRIVCATRSGYAFAAFGLFGLLFVLAALLVFLLPVGSVLLLLGSILLLVVLWIGGEALAAIERLLARPAIRQGRCPNCGADLAVTRLAAPSPTLRDMDRPIDPLPEVLHQCTGCPAIFLGSGERYLEDPDHRPGPAVVRAG
jgi:hypothetical protein